jgi:hypothetical protein
MTSLFIPSLPNVSQLFDPHFKMAAGQKEEKAKKKEICCATTTTNPNPRYRGSKEKREKIPERKKRNQEDALHSKKLSPVPPNPKRGRASLQIQ